MHYTGVLKVTYPDAATKWATVSVIAFLSEDSPLKDLAEDLIRYAEACERTDIPFQLEKVIAWMAEERGFFISKGKSKSLYGERESLAICTGEKPDTITLWVER